MTLLPFAAALGVAVLASVLMIRAASAPKPRRVPVFRTAPRRED